jgi:hypothetical protein
MARLGTSDEIASAVLRYAAQAPASSPARGASQYDPRLYLGCRQRGPPAACLLDASNIGQDPYDTPRQPSGPHLERGSRERTSETSRNCHVRHTFCTPCGVRVGYFTATA